MERKIKIGKKEYTILYVNRISGNNKKNFTTGDCDPKKRLIRIIKCSKEEERNTLFHELTHAILNELHDSNPKFERRLRQLYKDEEIICNLSWILKEMFNIKEEGV